MFFSKHFRLYAALALAAPLPCIPISEAAPAQQHVPPRSSEQSSWGPFGVNLADMDTTVKPGDDFDRFVNGNWEKNTTIPPDKARWGEFDRLRDLSDQRTREVVEATLKDAKASPRARKVGMLYASFMDEAEIEKRGITPLKAELAAIMAISQPAQLATYLGSASRDGITVPIQVGVDLDAKNPDMFVVNVEQGGLGLPDRDYYQVKDNQKYAEAREAYLAHVERMLTLAGIDAAHDKAQKIFDLETKIAAVHWSRVDNREADKRYNPVAIADLSQSFPGLDWQALLAGAHLSGQSGVIVGPPSAIKGIAQLVAATPLETWQDYFIYHLISARASVLPKAFVEEDFALRKVLSGTPELKVRWKRGVDFVNAGMGDAVGQLYVAQYFPPEVKAQADALVQNILIAMKHRLEKVQWMEPKTRASAVEKLAHFTPKIGYPTKWRDDSALTVTLEDAYDNMLNFTRFNYDYEASKLGKPADRDEWYMTPQTVNAYANFSWNEIVFPAAILQPPFFNPEADAAVNYGAIGAVIGHEISHHFDDQGRKYDATGRLMDWWTPTDVQQFKTYTQRVVKQYDAYEPLPGVHVNGALTLGENMADLAGINVAYDAWRLSLKDEASSEKNKESSEKGKMPSEKGVASSEIAGYTGDQRFFLGFGQIWRSKMRDALLQAQLTIDPHTPSHYRPTVVRNMDVWYTAFDVQPGQKLYLSSEQRIKVW